METFSALLTICAGNSPVAGEFPAQRPVTRSFDIFLICVWINGWVNNREAGDLRCYRTYYDVTVMNYRTSYITLKIKVLLCNFPWKTLSFFILVIAAVSLTLCLKRHSYIWNSNNFETFKLIGESTSLHSKLFYSFTLIWYKKQS